MPTEKKHPSRYDQEYYEHMRNALKWRTVKMSFTTVNGAVRMRQRFYGARSTLKRNPKHDPKLAKEAHHLIFHIRGSELEIRDRRKPRT